MTVRFRACEGELYLAQSARICSEASQTSIARITGAVYRDTASTPWSSPLFPSSDKVRNKPSYTSTLHIPWMVAQGPAVCALPSAVCSTPAVAKCCTSGSSADSSYCQWLESRTAPLETWVAHFVLWYWGRDLQLKPNSSQPLLWWHFIRNPFARCNQGSFVSKIDIFAMLLFIAFCSRSWCYTRNKVLNFCSYSSSFPMTLRPIFGPCPPVYLKSFPWTFFLRNLFSSFICE
jgi:hypothetical protein